MDATQLDPVARQTLALAGELRVVIGKLQRRLREQAGSDLTHSQKSVLLHLEGHGPTTVSALARAEGVRPQSMGATVATLQAAGLLQSAPHPTDGRQSLLSLTPACRQKMQSGRAAREDWLFHALEAQLSAKEQAQLQAAVELLRRLVSS